MVKHTQVSADTSATSVARARLRLRNLRTLALLAALFFLPLLLAFITYYGSPWRPARHVNHGLLITSARGAAAGPLCRTPGRGTGRWSTSAPASATPTAARRFTSCARRTWRSALT